MIVAQAGLAAWAATLLLVGPSAIICIAVSGHAAPAFAIWTLLAVVLVSGAYVAAFGWLALRTRRPVIFGFLYILLWEGSIATFAASANRLSIAAYGRAVLARAVPDAPRFNVPTVGAGVGAVVLGLVICRGRRADGARLRPRRAPLMRRSRVSRRSGSGRGRGTP